MKATNPKGPDKGSARIYRGGSWNEDAGGLVVSFRGGYGPGARGFFLGLRVVCGRRKE